MHRNNKIIIYFLVGSGESSTFITSNSEEVSKIKFYLLLCRIIYLALLKYLLFVCR